MFLSYEEFARRAGAVQAAIAAAAQAAGRPARDIQLLAVTKQHPPAAAEYAARFGLRAVGENRVQEGVEKRAQVTAPLQWELIGHLQSNKAAVAARAFDRVQSVDREKLLGALDQAAAQAARTLPILLQINAGRDPAKFGADPAEAQRLLEAALAHPHLRVEGLMTIAPLSDDPAVAERTFATLRQLRDDLAARCGHPLRELSMGMSGDFAAAIAAGSTLIRVGSALFGERFKVAPGPIQSPA
jgi:pyridoxal phosphate enzyme (YggS family)